MTAGGPGGPGRVPVAVLISGRGSNMQSLVEACAGDGYPAEVVAVISNRPDAAGIAWADDRGIPTTVVDHTKFDSRQDFDEELHKIMLASGADIICLAGFMRILTDELVRQWEGRMINIHPSLLPLFEGLHTHARALEAGVRLAGCTVHYVTPELDSGPIIAQAAVPVLPDDSPESLAARVLLAEHRLYPEAIRLVASGAARLADGRVALDAGADQSRAIFSIDISKT